MKSESSSKSKGKRRQFTAEFKAEAIQLARSPGQSIARVAKDLGIVEGNLRNWIKQADIDAGKGPHGALSTAEKEELAALRRENKQLRMEREILRKAAAYFAKEQI